MSLTNAQYDTVMREYNRRQIRAQRRRDERLRKILGQVDGYSEAERLTSDLACRAAIARAGNPHADISALEEQIQDNETRKKDLLLQAGYPADYLDLQYQCPDCQDTGYTGSVKCHCFRQLVVELFYTQASASLEEQTDDFAQFRLDLYPDKPLRPDSPDSIRSLMNRTYLSCRRFADTFDPDKTTENLLLFGGVGLGKTFLSRCIASQLRREGCSVLYSSSAELFKELADETFHRENAAGGDLSAQLGSCDLLIIDDLGTEMTNTFISSALFDILNRRLSAGKPMLFSTNLSLRELSETYSERCISRILGHFTMLPFYGDDIRLALRLS